ncbi:DNA-binding transcriptional regulator [Coraliomargarita sp. SDUM461004]|uniref:DNA-binding transcriptional regulator n=1 Tax=Thalassobacterium sedimentorum TaxID=3041258 RepID=A0ABU1AI85_9BACT|nr:DNA-binding transcriptional regulator [Coraliomargarita sp. SDUM461004]MDQ8194532.1 DNA-binding transcriptional regulator [Coraliomargarita sp. SDUM461004]
MSQKATIRIALLLGQDLGYSRRVLSGVLNYAESKQLSCSYHNGAPDVRIIPALEQWQPHGVIVHLSERILAERLQALSLPMVSVTHTLKNLPISHVDVDSVAVGQVAADYFLSQGLRSFAYYGSRHAVFSCNRERGFRERLEVLGYPVANLHADFLPQPPFSQDWTRMDRQTERWLQRLPKPVGILASNDIPARALCELCRNVGLRVPDEVAILGVDNDVSECRMSDPSLSSVELPAEQIGRDAMQLLLSQLGGGHAGGGVQRLLPPMGVIVRSSTDHRGTAEPLLQRALDYIERYADRGISVVDVCRHAGRSRRSMERRFQDYFQSTIYQRIQQVQLARAKRLLLESELSISVVADRAGFSSLRQLDRVFRKYETVSPSAYRKLL